MTAKWTYPLLLVIINAFTGARAETPPDIIGLLKARQFSSLDAHFTQVDQAFARHQISEWDYIGAYKALYSKEDTLSVELKRWVDAEPRSFYAHLARGIYYRKLGELNRGAETIDRTDPAKLIYMTRMHRVSLSELLAARELNSRAYLPVLHLLNVAQFEGAPREAARYIELANQLYPENIVARARYVSQLMPRWGGSYAEAEKFVEACRAAGVSDAHLRWLRSIIVQDRAMVSWDASHRPEDTLGFREALKLTIDAPAPFKETYMFWAKYICSAPPDAGQPYCR